MAQPLAGYEPQLQLLSLLEIFNQTTYTLFHRYPYLGTTYLTIIGWSVTWFFAAYSLFGREATIRAELTLGKH